MANKPNGIVLVTGPTGSGKTVSLYTCLNILNQPGVNIATVEDPAEINLPGINQVNVNVNPLPPAPTLPLQARLWCRRRSWTCTRAQRPSAAALPSICVRPSSLQRI